LISHIARRFLSYHKLAAKTGATLVNRGWIFRSLVDNRDKVSTCNNDLILDCGSARW